MSSACVSVMSRGAYECKISFNLLFSPTYVVHNDFQFQILDFSNF